MPSKIAVTRALGIAVVHAFCVIVHGGQVAYDTAGDSAYNSGWIQGSSGGFGWGGGWAMTGTPQAIPIIASSTTNGIGDPEGDGDINSPRTSSGRAWGLVYGTATRGFGGALSIGQTFSIDYDDYGSALSPNHYSDLYLITPGGADAVGLLANRSLDYLVALPDGSRVDTGVAETDQGIHLTFTQLASGIQVSLTPYVPGATATTLNVPYNGQLSGITFDSIGFYVADPNEFAYYTPYINNMSITPEPAALALIGLGAGGMLIRRRRQT
jgi:hypothetical protein